MQGKYLRDVFNIIREIEEEGGHANRQPSSCVNIYWNSLLNLFNRNFLVFSFYPQQYSLLHCSTAAAIHCGLYASENIGGYFFWLLFLYVISMNCNLLAQFSVLNIREMC